MFSVEVGKEYKVWHSRKGKFRMRVHRIDGRIIEGEITSGTAHYLAGPDRVIGDPITLKLDNPFMVLHPVEA